MSPKEHLFGFKIGSSHGLWQYKVSGTHDRMMMHGLRLILDNACQLLGYDYADRSIVYLFHFSAEPFEGYQVCLAKMRESPDDGYNYQVVHSNIGRFQARGRFPSFFKTDYLHEWPAEIYFKLDRSTVGGIVN
jgi:hypothetical protein